MNKKHPNKEYKMKVGENILYRRKLKGLKQEDLAERIGISPTALSNIENGVSKPDIERLEDIADALEIEVSQLLTNPQQMFTFNNSPQSNGVIYGTNSQSNVDKDLLDRVVSVMEKITSYFTGNSQKNPS
jgi:transcriptional regulator with XRE-family HTH domain